VIAEESIWQKITFFILTFAVVVLCALILQPFFPAIVGAIVLAVATQRPYNWLATKIHNRSTSAAIALILVVLAIVIPSYFLAQDLAQQGVAAVTVLRDDAHQKMIADFIARHPDIATRIYAFTDSIDPNNAVRATATYLSQHIGSVLGGSARTITQLVVMLFILFFLFRDRDLAIACLRSLLPLRDDETTELLHRLNDTIYATALGRVAIAAIQGILAGVSYWLLGVPGIILWAFTTAVMATIPAFGAILVWAPIALYLGFSGHWGKAAILAIWGGVVVSTIDNILYPILIGSRLRDHTVIILISILGGISFFGITGIVIGPVIFALADTLLDFWHARRLPPSTTPAHPPPHTP
jgi:predicted PurR-regulated permease PerM